jgi:DNA-binding protein YbaB
MMDTAKMMANAYKLKQAIEAEVLEVEENGIKITIGGDLKVKSVSVNNMNNDDLKDAINNAIRKAQELQVLKMREMGDLKDITEG